MAETKEFSTLVVASTITGISLCDGLTVSQFHECAEWLCGHPVWTHELVHAPTKDRYVTEALEQFPDMPTAIEAHENLSAAAAKAIAAYGIKVSVKRGQHERRENPADTLHSVAPNAKVVIINAGKR